MHDYCDIHNHLLHEVDDGSTSLEETLTYLCEFRREGVTDLVFTPHLLAPGMDRPAIDETLALHRERFEEVVAETNGDDAVPGLALGQEILARRPADLDLVAGRSDVGLGGGDALLVELGFSEGFDGDGVIARVLAEGRRIVLAHPERYRYPDGEALDTARRWRDAGALLQVNGGSVAGLYTERAQVLSQALLEADLVDLVSTDHHAAQRAHSVAMIGHTLAAEGRSPDELMAGGPRMALGPETTAGQGAPRLV